MYSVINQFKRIYNDNGSDDKLFDIQERRLRWSLDNLKRSIEEVVRSSQTLHDLMTARKPPPQMH